MVTNSVFQEVEKHIPVIGNINLKSDFGYKTTRGAIATVNALQMALAESYINGLEVSDVFVKSLLDIFLPIFYKNFPSLLISHEWLLQESDRLAEGSSELMQIQYNLPTELFRIMLEESELIYPKYSVGLWEKGATNLQQAQKDMLDDLIKKADIQDGDRILDLGCGWGCAANYLLSQFPNIRVTGLNLSREQCQYIRQKMQDSHSYLANRFTLCEQDFNEANFAEKFDKIITIGFFEHVGNLSQSFQRMADWLKDTGKVFLHIISVRLPHSIWNPFIDKYIFHRARVWHYEAIPTHNQHLKTIDRWYLNGFNYSKTLKAWLKNFDNHWEKLKTLDYGIDKDKFRRIWRLYLLWCIAYFDSCQGKILGNGQYLMIKS